MDTERHSPRYSAIDVWSPTDILDAMIEGQFAAVAAVRAARPALEAAVLAMEPRLRDGGRLVYAGAGTSGRLAVQDGAELMPTFSWPQDRLLLLIAGGREALVQSVEGAEDESEQAIGLVREHAIEARDVLIAVAASGTTPFTLACLSEAKQRGALTIGIANNRYAHSEKRRAPGLARHRRGADRRLDPHESRHSATDRAELAVVIGNDPPRPGL
jgi:N-acetylmuramic acid 6-phosphate etherase